MESVNQDLMNRASALRKIVVVNEGIKGVIAISSAMNITAINAMLSAKQAGERVRGFNIRNPFADRLPFRCTDLIIERDRWQ